MLVFSEAAASVAVIQLPHCPVLLRSPPRDDTAAALSRLGCTSIHTSVPTPLAGSHTDFLSASMGYWCVMHST